MINNTHLNVTAAPIVLSGYEQIHFNNIMIKKEKLLKKSAEYMAEIGNSDLLSDYEVTVGVALRTAEWSNQKLIDDACKWLKSHINDYFVQGRNIDHMFDDFRKAMEE